MRQAHGTTHTHTYRHICMYPVYICTYTRCGAPALSAREYIEIHMYHIYRNVYTSFSSVPQNACTNCAGTHTHTRICTSYMHIYTHTRAAERVHSVRGNTDTHKYICIYVNHIYIYTHLSAVCHRTLKRTNIYAYEYIYVYRIYIYIYIHVYTPTFRQCAAERLH